jgi:hypothetical protein
LDREVCNYVASCISCIYFRYLIYNIYLFIHYKLKQEKKDARLKKRTDAKNRLREDDRHSVGARSSNLGSGVATASSADGGLTEGDSSEDEGKETDA